MKTRTNAVYYSDASFGERISGVFWNTKPIMDDIFLNKTPSPEDIEQTTIGNCYLLAALKTIVRRNPEAIYEMIKDIGNDRIAVRFYTQTKDSSQLSIEMWYQIDKSIVVHAINKFGFGHKAPWVYLIEKAYAAHRMRDADFIQNYKIELWKKKTKKKWKELTNIEIYENAINQNITTHEFSYEKILKSGTSRSAFEDLLGCSAETYEIRHPNENLINLVKFDGGFIKTDVLDDIFKNDDKCFLSLIKNLVLLTSEEEKGRAQEAELLAEKIKDNKVTQLDIMNYFKKYFPKLDKLTLNAIELAVFQGIDIKLGEKRYSRESVKMYTLIHNKLASGELVCLSTISKDSKKDMTGLVPDHAYEAINCYQKDGRCMLVLSNPWRCKVREYQFQNENSDFFVPKNKQFFWVKTKNNNNFDEKKDESFMANIAIANKTYVSNVILNEQGTFELDLNDFMTLFSDMSFTNTSKDKNEYMGLIRNIENEIDKEKNNFSNLLNESILNEEAMGNNAEKILKLREKQENIFSYLNWLDRFSLSKSFVNEENFETKLAINNNSA